MHSAGLQLFHGDTPTDMIAAAARKADGVFERLDDWSSCAYFYLDQPENKLPPLAPLPQRVEEL